MGKSKIKYILIRATPEMTARKRALPAYVTWASIVNRGLDDCEKQEKEYSQKKPGNPAGGDNESKL